MGWANSYIAKLQNGETVSFRPRGNSMTGRINSGDLCTVEPIGDDPKAGDIVLCTVRGAQYLHLVKGTRRVGDKVEFQIGNNRGHVNGWTPRHKVYGVLVAVSA